MTTAFARHSKTTKENESGFKTPLETPGLRCRELAQRVLQDPDPRLENCY